MSDSALTTLPAIRAAIVEAETIGELVNIGQQLKLMQHMMEIADATLEQINELAIERMNAIRAGGKILAAMKRGKAGNPNFTNTRQPVGNSEYQTAITDSSLSERQAQRWQEAAAPPDVEFDKWIDHRINNDWDITLGSWLQSNKPASLRGTKQRKINGYTFTLRGDSVMLDIKALSGLMDDAQWLDALRGLCDPSPNE